MSHPLRTRKNVTGSVQSLSCVRLFVTPWTTACQASLSITNSWSLPRLMSIESVMPSNQLILCHPRLLPSIFLRVRAFSNKLVLHIRWPKSWSFRFNISPSNEYSGLVSFTIDWLDMTERLNWTNFLLNLLDLSLSSNLCAGRKLSSGLYSAVLTEHSGYISR